MQILTAGGERVVVALLTYALFKVNCIEKPMRALHTCGCHCTSGNPPTEEHFLLAGLYVEGKHWGWIVSS